jgi:hypothetical protein
MGALSCMPKLVHDKCPKHKISSLKIFHNIYCRFGFFEKKYICCDLILRSIIVVALYKTGNKHLILFLSNMKRKNRRPNT